MAKPLRTGIALGVGLLSFFLAANDVQADEFESESLTGADPSFNYGFEHEREVRRFEESIRARDEEEADALRAEADPGEIDTPRFRFFPSFRVSSLYDSNLFLSHHDPIDDAVFIYSPALSVRMGKPGKTRQFVRAFFNLSLVDFVENDHLSRANQTHTLAWGIRGEKWRLTLDDRFQPLSAREAGERSELTGGIASRVVATTNAFNANLAYDLTPKTELSLLYSHGITVFPDTSNENNTQVKGFSFQSNTISASVAYEINTRNTVDLSGFAGINDYFEGGGFSSRQFGLSLRYNHRLTRKTDVLLRGGFEWRDYLLPSIPASEGPAYAILLRHRLTEKVVLNLSFAQSERQEFDFTEFSTEADSFDSSATDYRAEVSWAMSPHMATMVFGAIQTSERDRIYAVPDDEQAGVVHSGVLEDQVYRVGLEWKWRPPGPWTYFFSYENLTKLSSFRLFEFDDQRVGGYVRKAF